MSMDIATKQKLRTNDVRSIGLCAMGEANTMLPHQVSAGEYYVRKL